MEKIIENVDTMDEEKISKAIVKRKVRAIAKYSKPYRAIQIFRYGVKKTTYCIVKRIFDIGVGLVGTMLTFPILAVVKIAYLKDGDHDSIIFKQERIGKGGKPIYIYKIRSMVPNAEKILDELMEKDPKIKEEYEKNKKLENDPRITKVGAFIRKTSLDEFCQFWAVLTNKMSIIGPRPYLPREKKDMGEYYQDVIQCKPGITRCVASGAEGLILGLQIDVNWIDFIMSIRDCGLILRYFLRRLRLYCRARVRNK